MNQRNSQLIFIEKHIQELINHKLYCADGSCACQRPSIHKIAISQRTIENQRKIRSFLTPEDIFDLHNNTPKQPTRSTTLQSPRPAKIFSTAEQIKDRRKMQMNQCQWLQTTKAHEELLKKEQEIDRRAQKLSADTFKRQSQFYLMKIERNYQNCVIATEVLQKIVKKNKQQKKRIRLPKIISSEAKKDPHDNYNQQLLSRRSPMPMLRSKRDIRGLLEVNNSLIVDCQVALKSQRINTLEY